MATLCDVTNIVQARHTATCASPVAGPSRIKLDSLQQISSSNTNVALTPPSDLETASESGSEWQSTDCSSADEGEDGDRTMQRSTRRRRRRSTITESDEVNTIFFGTPSKEELERMARYQEKLRTKRVQRRDSIELARRKSIGSGGSRSSLPGNGNAMASSSQDYHSALEGTSDQRLAIAHKDDSKRPLSSSDDFFSAPTSLPQQAGDGAEGLATGLGDLASHDGVANTSQAVAEATVEDPDATEDADWFGLSSEPARLASSELSPPSTPTRKGGIISAELSAGPLDTPSEADSSPGVALSNRNSRGAYHSPLEAYKTTPTFAPFAVSPLATQHDENITSLQAEKENATPASSTRSPSRSRVLQDSPQKANAARSPWLMSPSKADLRGKLAAWADSRVLSPVSPAKSATREIRELHSTSPSLAKKAAQAVFAPRPEPAIIRKQRQPSDVIVQKGGRVTPRDTTRVSRLPVPAPRSQAAGNTHNRSSDTQASAKTPHTESRASSRANPGQQNRLEEKAKSQAHGTRTSAGVPRTRLFTKPRVSSSSVSSSRSPLSSSDSIKAKSTFAKPVGRFLVPAVPTKSSSSNSSSPNKTVQRPVIRDARLICGTKERILNVEQAAAAEQISSSELSSAASSTDSRSEHRTPSSDGVGGARRVLMGVARPTPSPLPLSRGERDARSTDVPIKPLISRSHQQVTPLSRDRSAARSRPMRKIGDYVGSTPRNFDSGDANMSSSPAPRIRESPIKPQYVQQHKDDLSQVLQQEPQHGPEARRSNPVRLSRAKPISQQQKMPPPQSALPLSSAELSRLTTLHTRMNENCTAEKEVVVIRKLGEVRPPSPSSRFRRDAREHDVSQDIPESPMPGMWVLDGGGWRSGHGHAYGAGDEEPYTTPVRHVSLKPKSVHWHKALFMGPSDATVPTTLPFDSSLAPVTLPRASCLRTPRFHLDKYGNVPKAERARLTLQKPRIRITKVVYDDDDDAGSE